MNSSPLTIPFLRATLLALGVVVSVMGCRLGVDPFTEALSGQPVWTTPSVEAARAVQVERVIRHRASPTMEVHAKRGTVRHGPLYFEDGCQKSVSPAGMDAWSGDDYLLWFYGSGRFLVDIVFFPVNALVTPPWLVVSSEGRPEPWLARAEAPDGNP